MSTKKIDDYLSLDYIKNYISALNRSKIINIGTKDWWTLQDHQQQLSHQALTEVEKSLVESVKKYLIEYEKIPVLVHEAICISVWREEIFPQLVNLTEKEPTKNFLVYMVLYHETTAVSLLEAVLYHPDACKTLGDSSIDLIDYCAENITNLFSRGSEIKHEDEQDLCITSQLKNQERSLTFGVGIRCIAIIQYLAEHMESLPLSAITRLYQTHDFPMLLAHLIEVSPWVKVCDGGKVVKYADGQWREQLEGCPIERPEAHTWLALHQLLLYPELGRYYHMTEFARSQLMKLDGKISDWLLGQLPPLHQLRQGLLHLARFQLPATRQPIILEIIPEIRNMLLHEKAQGWDKLVEHQAKLLIHCSASQAAEVAERLCKTLCAVSVAPNVCMLCSRPAKSRCSRCKSAWYCSRQCQVSHFPHHKKDCQDCSK